MAMKALRLVQVLLVVYVDSTGSSFCSKLCAIPVFAQKDLVSILQFFLFDKMNEFPGSTACLYMLLSL